VLDILIPEAGSFYIMDRGFTDFARWFVLHQAQAFFVIRAKSNLLFRRVYSRPVDKSTGLCCDQTIVLTSAKGRKDYPQHLRRIKFYDAEHDKDLVFLTNNFDLPALTIAQLYRCRWQSLPPRRRGSNYSSSGSNSIFVSNASTALPRMQSRRKSGSPLRFTSWLPS